MWHAQLYAKKWDCDDLVHMNGRLFQGVEHILFHRMHQFHERCLSTHGRIMVAMVGVDGLTWSAVAVIARFKGRRTCGWHGVAKLRWHATFGSGRHGRRMRVAPLL